VNLPQSLFHVSTYRTLLNRKTDGRLDWCSASMLLEGKLRAPANGGAPPSQQGESVTRLGKAAIICRAFPSNLTVLAFLRFLADNGFRW